MDGEGRGPWRQLAAFDPLEDGVAAGVEDELDVDEDEDEVDDPLDDEAVSDDEEDLRLSVR